MEAGLVRYIESRARALHLAYDHATPPRQLLERVLSREHQAVGALGPEALPACYGNQFAGPYDPACDVCRVQTACAARLAWNVFPELETNDSAHMAQALGLDAKAVVLAQTFAREAAGQDTGPFGGYTRLPKPPRPKALALSDIPRPPGLSARAALVGARARHAAWQRDVTLPVVPGSPKLWAFARVAYFRPPPKSPAWRQRHARERKRSVLYAQLKVGMVLRKVHRGILHEVRVARGSYVYEGQSYPTLYAVVQAIAGSIACPRPYAEDHTRPPGVRHTAYRSPLHFFDQAFKQLVARMPAKKKAKKSLL